MLYTVYPAYHTPLEYPPHAPPTPRLFDTDLVAEVLDELARLMPTHDPRQVLLSDPSWVLKVERGPRRLGQHPDM